MTTRYRLPPDLQDDLTWYWCVAEAELGVRSDAYALQQQLLASVLAKQERPSGVRLSLAGENWRRAQKDEALRIYCLFGKMKQSESHVHRDPMPDGAEFARRRILRVHAAVTRMVKEDGGPAHERVLYRVLGPPSRHPLVYGRVGNDLAPLVEYAALVVEAMGTSQTPQQAAERALKRDAAVGTVRKQCDEMLSDAGRAYAAAHEAEKQDRRAMRRARIEAELGAVA